MAGPQRTLDVDPVLATPRSSSAAFGRIHHRPGAADEPGIDRARIVDQMLDRLVAGLAVEHAVEQVDVARFVAEEMIEFEPADVAVLERRQRLEEDDRAGVAVAVEQVKRARGSALSAVGSAT